MKNLPKKRLIPLLLCNCALLFAKELTIDYKNKAVGDYYRVTGDKRAGLYNTSKLFQPYNEFFLTAKYFHTPYNKVRFQLFGVASDSLYRTKNERGLVPEKINLLWERGDVALPFRLSIGDFYGYFSYRTLQRSLKGIQLEVQPQVSKNVRQSLMFLTGTVQRDWRDFRWGENSVYGASYLIEYEKNRISFNAVRNEREATLNYSKSGQNILSIAFERPFSFEKRDVRLESEVSFFRGDYRRQIENKSATALYLQTYFKEKSLPLSYKLRYERNSKYYKPDGVNVRENRKSYQAYMNYFFSNGINLNLYGQYYKDDFQSNNPLTTKIFGISTSGNFKRVSTSLLLSKKLQENNTMDRTTDAVTLNLGYPLYTNVNARARFSYIKNRDNKAHRINSLTKQMVLGADYFPHIENFNLIVSPSLLLSERRFTTDIQKIIGPKLAINLSKDRHTLRFNAGYTDQRMDVSPDIATVVYALNYNYRKKSDQFGIEFLKNTRDPQNAQSTDSYKVSLYWIHTFSKRYTFHQTAKAENVPQNGVKAKLSPVLLTVIKPGMPTKDVLDILQKLGLWKPLRIGDMYIYETKLFDDINYRQRFVIVDNDGRIQKDGLVIDYPLRDVDEFIHTFEWIKKRLIDLYGAPTNYYERGEVSKQLFEDIQNEQFIRIYEWKRSKGILRLGIPRRFDGKVRIEIVFAPHFPDVTYTVWGFQELN